jgi:hypothetical protein
MKVKAIKPFNDGWAQKYRQESEVFEANEEAVKYFDSLGLIEEPGKSGVVDLGRMNKEKLLEYAAEQGIEIDETLTKKEIIERLTAEG